MKGEWCMFNSYFTPQQCEQIVTMANNLPKQKANMGPNGEVDDNTHRKTQIAFLQPHMEEFKDLFSTMWDLAVWANNDWFNFNISKFDYIQYADYSADEKSEYKKHCDVFWMNNDPLFHRKLSMVVQLTDPNTYTGGDLFVDAQQPGPADRFRDQGTVILFPAFTYHWVTPMITGKRNSLAIWIDGPKWK